MNRLVVFVASALACMVTLPLFVSKNLQLGDYAKSPQEVTVQLGASKFVAGGMAKLSYAGGQTGKAFEIGCKAETKYFEPKGKKSYSACHVNVELLRVEEPKRGAHEVPRATFRITWKQ